MKKNSVSGAIVLVALISKISFSNPTPSKGEPLIVKPTINFDLNSPAPGDTFGFSSKQPIEWSISGLPSGKHKIAVFLKNLTEGQKGIIAVAPVRNGKGHLQLVVNEIEYVDGTYTLTNGKYDLSLAIYEESKSNNVFKLGKKIIEIRGGPINIAGSDVSADK